MRFKLLTLLFVFIIHTVKAQFNHDFDIEPKPYQGKEYYGDVVSSGIKKIRQIKTVDTERGEYNDTVRILTYGDNGKRTGFTYYKKNKIESTYTYKYKGDTEMVWEEMRGPSIIYRSQSKYDKGGNILVINNHDLKGRDTLNRQQATFTYMNGKLIAREDRINNILRS